MAEFRFLRVIGGVTRFAKATVAAEAASEWRTVQSENVRSLAGVYGDAIDRGVNAAIRAHSSQGGAPYRVHVLEIIESAVDTSVDVVECAVAVATWKSFGHDEADAVLEALSGTWGVRFKQEVQDPEPT